MLLSLLAARGENPRYSAMIEMEKAYLSGVCIVNVGANQTLGSVFNEFGVSALDFSYDRKKGKLKLLSVFKPMDKWYIRRVLSGDLKKVVPQLEQSDNDTVTYANSKYKIRYRFIKLKESNDTLR